ncbi:MAG: hypothetical protein GQE15_03260 [Archangiaceae bacterium]|nr:hypothetical protein [Archangiaceae bacterium]
MSGNDRYFALLQSLAASGVRFATFGTAGLLLRHAELRERYALRDADVLLAPDQLEAFAAWARGRGGTVTTWSEPFEPGLNVRGRFYLRAKVDGLQLDATYETFLDLEGALREATSCDGVPTCSDLVIWRAKVNKDRDAAVSFANAMGLALCPDLIA